MLKKNLIIIIPVYNEEKTIFNLIKKIPKIEYVNQKNLVINDGSLDNSSIIAEEAGAIVINHHKHLGLGQAFKTGLIYCLKSRADIIILLDGDGQYDPNKIESLIIPILEDKFDLVIGNRFSFNTFNEISYLKKLGNKIISTFLSKIILHLKEAYDMQCSFRAFNQKLAKFCSEHFLGDYNYAQEMFILTKLCGFSIKQIPVDCHERVNGKSRLIKNLIVHLIRILWVSFRTYFRIKLNLKNTDYKE